MWVIAGLLVTAGICAAVEVPSLTAYKKDLWVFILLMLLSTALSLAMAMKAAIPNPLDAIAAVFGPLGSWMKQMFQ